MRLHVYFMPAALATVTADPNDIYIVIDVIRATTCMTVILGQGATGILAAQTVEQAQEAARVTPGALLCGERHALPLPGFDYGNSPVEFAHADLRERILILTTTNGTRAFYACPDTSVRLGGSFYNTQAVTSLALQLAREKQSNIAIVCAGEAGYFALDDAICAGYLALELQLQEESLRMHESVKAAQALYTAFPRPKLLESSRSARSVTDVGLQDDLAMCMTIDGSTTVPMVKGRDEATGLLLLQKA